MTTALLTIAIRNDWHPGTGAASGFHLDARAHVGADGCPRLPGRHCKGLLRDALWRAEQWRWAEVPAGSTEALFGGKADDEHHSTPGLLRVSDAVLPNAVRAYLAGDEGAPLRDGLFREHHSTAIDGKTGVALGRTLRGMQTVVPLTLTARISEIPGAAPVPDWPARIDAVLPLIGAVGAARSRGFGRALLTLKEED